MQRTLLAAAMFLFTSFPVWAADKGEASTPVLTTTTTSSGQQIVLPQKDAQVVVKVLEVSPGTLLPQHKHPYPRYGYMLAGSLHITNDETGKDQTYEAGDFIIEALDQWHHAEPVGTEPVKLLVIDQVEKDHANIELRK